ncbi:MAG: hypothetical protein AB8B72_14820 [Crocinitomicaceae bacterium]
MKTFKFFLVVILFFFQPHIVFGQGKDYFSFEALGSGGFGSINYERPILEYTDLNFHLRFGFSFTPIDKSNGANLIFPIMLHWLVGKSAHKFDLGVGQAVSMTTKARFFLSGVAAAGYRYQPLDKNYFLRASYTPLVSFLVGFQAQHWAGITFGYHFNRRE